MTRRERRALEFGHKATPTTAVQPEAAPAGPVVDPLPGETVLDDDYPVHWDYAYIADGRIVRSDIQGTVRDLKRATGAAEIRRCEIVKRRIY